jgi:hypothetical protein
VRSNGSVSMMSEDLAEGAHSLQEAGYRVDSIAGWLGGSAGCHGGGAESQGGSAGFHGGSAGWQGDGSRVPLGTGDDKPEPYQMDFDEFFIEQTVGELTAMGEEGEGTVGQAGRDPGRGAA